MDQCDTKIDLIERMWVIDLNSSDFALYLEDYLMDGGHTFENGSV